MKFLVRTRMRSRCFMNEENSLKYLDPYSLAIGAITLGIFGAVAAKEVWYFGFTALVLLMLFGGASE